MHWSTYVPKVRRMLLFLTPLIFTHFWPASTLLRGHLPLAILSPLEIDPQILERWGYADEFHLGKCIRAKDFCPREFYTFDWSLHVRALPENRLRRLHVLKYTTQMSCFRWSAPNTSVFQLMTSVTVDVGLLRSIMQLMLFQQSYCTFVIVLFGPSTRLFINLTMCIRALFTKSATTLGLVEQALWRVALFTEWIGASSFRGNPCMAVDTFYHWDSFLFWDFGFSMFIAHSAAWKNSETDLMVRLFPCLLIPWRKLQLSPLEHCSLYSHCQQSPRILCTRCFVHWFLTTAFLSNFPFLAPKLLFRISCSILLFTIVFNLW